MIKNRKSILWKANEVLILLATIFVFSANDRAWTEENAESKPVSTPDANHGSWPNWRGPNGDCQAEAQLPAKLPEKLTLRWSAKSQIGISAPIVANGCVFLHSRTENTEDVTARNAATGKDVWHWNQPAAGAPDPEGYFPAATPAWRDGKLYLHSIASALLCLDATKGTEVWKRDLVKEFDAPGPGYGPAASPLVLNDCVVLPVGGSSSGSVIGFDRTTGKTLWQAGKSPPGYASAVAGKVAGVDQLFVHGLRDFNIFKLKGTQYEFAASYEFDFGEGNQCTPAILDKDTVIITNEDNTTALRVTIENEMPKPKELWNVPHPGNMSSPLVFNQRIYLFSQGEIVCLSPKDGAVLSSIQLSGGYCSLARVGGTLLCLSNTGTMLVVDAAEPEMKKLAEYEMAEEETWAHLTVVDGLIFVRSRSELRCLAWSTP